VSDTKPDPSAEPAKFSIALGLTSLLALFSFVTLLAFNHLADGDLWAKLSLGASVWDHGDVVRRDFFAFTPVLPVYVDHEWGAGLIFFSCLKWFGPTSLMILKIVLALATLGISMFFARQEKVSWPVLWLLVIPAFFCILTGYVLVIRSYAFTYFFFAVTLLSLEEVNRGRRWPIGLLVLVTWIWANVHGGFVVGLGMIGIYALLAVWRRGPWLLLGMTTLICLAVTFLNPYGAAFWRYLIPALLHSRPFITEWRPLALWPMDNYIGFRIIFFVAVIAVPLGWKHLEKNWTGLAVMAVTALAAWHSRRHTPFFGVAALMFLGPYIQAAWQRCFGKPVNHPVNDRLLTSSAFLIHGAMAIFIAIRFLPAASFQVLAPVSSFPVREVDVLKQADASGNLVVPFEWGSYASWRLYPQVKVSMDGRYEAAYPETTFMMSLDFHFKLDAHWDQLIRDFPVDFIILDLAGGKARPEDLLPYGYAVVWSDGKASALLASAKQFTALKQAAQELPPTTIEPLDARMPRHWWGK